MHRSEASELAVCIECGGEIWPERDRAYLITDDDVLCFGCALKRGGAYDERKDRWTAPPDLTGLKVETP